MAKTHIGAEPDPASQTASAGCMSGAGSALGQLQRRAEIESPLRSGMTSARVSPAPTTASWDSTMQCPTCASLLAASPWCHPGLRLCLQRLAGVTLAPERPVCEVLHCGRGPPQPPCLLSWLAGCCRGRAADGSHGAHGTTRGRPLGGSDGVRPLLRRRGRLQRGSNLLPFVLLLLWLLHSRAKQLAGQNGQGCASGQRQANKGARIQ